MTSQLPDIPRTIAAGLGTPADAAVAGHLGWPHEAPVGETPDLEAAEAEQQLAHQRSAGHRSTERSASETAGVDEA